MPGRVDDLLVKVQAVYTDLVLFAFPTCAHFARLQDGPRLAVLPRRLQGDVLPVATVKHPEEVVVGTGHHDAAVGSKSSMVLPLVSQPTFTVFDIRQIGQTCELTVSMGPSVFVLE